MDSNVDVQNNKLDREIETLQKFLADCKSINVFICRIVVYFENYKEVRFGDGELLISKLFDFFDKYKNTIYIIRKHIFEIGLRLNFELKFSLLEDKYIASDTRIWLYNIVKFGFATMLAHSEIEKPERARIIKEAFYEYLPLIYSARDKINLNHTIDNILYLGIETFIENLMAIIKFIKTIDITPEEKRSLTIKTFSRKGDGRWLMQIGFAAINIIQDSISKDFLYPVDSISYTVTNGEYRIELKKHLLPMVEENPSNTPKECPIGDYIEEIVTQIVNTLPDEYWETKELL